MRFALVLFNIGIVHLFAAPQGLVIARGEASSITDDYRSFTITASEDAVLHWSDFSIDANEKVSFIQPGPDAIAINRVIDPNPSRLLGQLSANGKIILINPSGIFVGREATIDTGSWIASTLDLNTDLFSKTRELEFEGISSSEIINEGTISTRSGDLFLVGEKIQNIGLLSGNGNRIGTFGSSSVKLSEKEFSFYFEPSEKPYGASYSVIQGRLTNPAGTIYVFGDTIGIGQTAIIDASSDACAGTIFIGGDYQGNNPHFTNSNWTFVEQGALIRSDAMYDGGRVIIWADSDTIFQGEISASGERMGGFAEVSGKKVLQYEGIANLQGGLPGTLLLDPTQITIAGATAGVALGNCGFPGNTYASTVAAGTLAAATLVGVLNGGTSVVITTSDGSCGPFAGTGDIRVNSAVQWSMAASSLTLNAVRDIIVAANVQDQFVQGAAGPDRVIFNAGRNITIAPGAVGSRDGGTSINCAGNLLLGPGASKIGFLQNVTCFGSIAVACNQLTMGGAGAMQIGHGNLGSPAGTPLITVGANITVTALDNINMTNGAGLNQHCKIGHGSAQLPAGSNQDGNITVSCGNALTMTGVTSGSSSTSIGHGPGFANARSSTFTGNIDVSVTNNLVMNGTSGGTAIGHGSLFTLANSSAITGDITVCCGGSASLTGAAQIAHRTAGNNDMAGDTITGDYAISIRGDLTLSNASSGTVRGPLIGFNNGQVQLLDGVFNLSVCGNVNVLTPSSGGAIGIGYYSNNTVSTTFGNIAIGGNLTGTNLDCLFRILSQGDLNLAAGGDIAISMAGDGFISSGLTWGAGLIPSTTRVYTGGSLLLTSNGPDVMSIGITPGPPNFAAATTTTNIDVRSGEDIQWANTYTATIPGSISIQAGYSFAAGVIWNGNGAGLTSICSQPVSFNLGCGSCTILAAASPAIASPCGGFFVQGAGGPSGPVNFTTGAGQPLTLASLCTSCSGGSTSLMVGSALGNTIQFGGGAGNVGPLILGAFNTIDINQNINSTGSIDISSCHDLNVNAGFTITSNGPITLIADVDDSGQGDLNLLGGNIVSNNNQICLLAAPGNFGCNSNNCFSGAPDLVLGALSSVNHLSGQINSGSAPTIINASGNILIDGSAVSILTTTGDISLTAGNNLTIEEDILSGSGIIAAFSGNNTEVNSSMLLTAGEIRMIAGNSLALNGTASITSTASSVTIVVDEQFPDSPLIGTGQFSMDCLAQINSGGSSPVRIFTALQSLNTICGSAMINGFSVSSLGVPGTLFNDTAYEMWCSYFDCPSPYPFSGLGFPFTIFYKNCLQIIVLQAMLVADQLLEQLHPYDEFPGWAARFEFRYDPTEFPYYSTTPYMIRRRQLNLLKHPKTYTQLIPD